MRWLGSWFSGLRGACGVDRGLAVCAWRTRTAASGTGVKKSLRQVPKALEILQREAVIIMYTQELGFVKKQIRLHTQLHLLQETCMQTKTGFYLLVIGVKR